MIISLLRLLQLPLRAFQIVFTFLNVVYTESFLLYLLYVFALCFLLGSINLLSFAHSLLLFYRHSAAPGI